MIVLITIGIFSIISCKKYKQGVLEIKHTITISNTENYYRAIIVEDGLYDPNVEFNYGPNYAGYYDTQTAYYWPDESAKSLGYKYRSHDGDGEFNGFITGKEGSSKIPGENGHWAGEGTTGGTGSTCPQGTWYSSACGDSKGVIWKFGSDKKGSFSNKDCNGICSPMVFTFSYEMSGTTCSISYDAVQPIVTCDGYQDSRPPTPNSTSITLSCSNDELTVTSGNGTQVFTK
ncbi:MAG: hypothetical protein M3Q58_01110 [Bacteroidota bacterium]|nr:hypothetical protein [Bacteroidota bacterium]